MTVHFNVLYNTDLMDTYRPQWH